MRKLLVFTLLLFLLSACESPPKGPLNESLTTKENIIALLENNGGCELPCFWGIIPGKTSWSDASYWLQDITNIYEDQVFYEDGNLPAYLLAFTLNDAKPYHQFSFIPTVGDEKIQRIYVKVQDTPEIISKYWQKYSLREMFFHLGKPDKAFFSICSEYSHPCFDGLLIYEKEKIALGFFGENLPENKVCPQLSEGGDITSISFSNVGQQSELDTLPPNWVSSEVKEYWTPIKDVLGIDENEFYERVLSDSPACFPVITTK
jgi:hypothetical protein